ncbi:MAG: hypothetical protein IJY39_03790 [Clostridia bacterium]|nr:hypothetical protein [Clostridia bacterium]
MKKSKLSFISAFLAFVMLGGTLVACTPANQNDETSDTSASEQTTESTTEAAGSESESESVTESETVPEIVIEGDYADTIMAANKLADGVQAYYDAARKKYTVVNQNMTLEYPLTSAVDQVVSSIKNKDGNSYIENTMDVFVKMTSGKTYYASQSTASARANIYKLGYYYYDVHLLEQNFMGGAEITEEKAFAARAVTGKHDVSAFKIKDDVITYTVDGSDPYVYTANSKSNDKYCFDTATYNAIQFTMKTTKSTNGELYFIAGSRTGHSADQRVSFSLEADGEWHTYTVVLSGVPDYTGVVTSLRFDVGKTGESIELKDIKAVKISTDAPNIVVDRNLHTYSDKMNQVLHFVAKEVTEGIEAFGLVTKIAADTVDKLVVKDAKGLHETIDGVDWNTAEYVGFDIKDAGIFGYILLQHENSGKLTITLEDGSYVITQTSAPKDGKMIPPNAKVTYTNNDFYMGQRIYTDENHTFDAFLVEAENERNPLQTVSGDSYLGYDALRGAYKFSIGGTGFNEPFFTYWNRHFESDVIVEGGDTDRKIYVYTYYSGGCGEGAALLGENDLLLPVPVMIYKNFGGEDEEPVFNAGDHTYSETYFPLVVSAGEKTTVKVLNLYMNWGAFPLKQLSSIQYFWPYYHLSIGTTETSCISPWYGARDLWTLPDFRSMSMPYWYELEGSAYSNQPQHTHGGYQYFLQYTDADGNYSATENINNDIDSSGPVYAEATMDYVSDDGRIKVSYTHLEYAQTDELRAYYEIEYEVLEDITIADFKNDFSFYSFEGYAGHYRKMGYIDESNQVVHKATNGTDTPEILKLGDKSPYVSLYDLYSSSANWATNNVNLGFVIYDSEFTIGGKECNEGFVIVGANYVYSLSLDLEEVTLKAGDTMKINMIISPWGWYNSTDDKNMQLIRENTCLDPLKVEVTDGEKLDSPFLPRIKSTNGKSAEFTLSGASNNVAVRVYGFEKLTAPKIYEKVDGKWVEYVVSSINTPDKLDYKHYYDGYNVYYDGDGTYSYAFTVNMDNAESRTFKVVAEEDFKGWPKIEVDENTDPLNVYINPEELATAAASNTGIGQAVISADKSYTSFYGNNSNPEGFFNAYSAAEETVTGQYLVIKYRVPTTVSEKIQFQIFTSTVNGGAAAADNFYLPALIQDGEWHILVADMSKQGLPTFSANANGKFIAKYARLDIFNCVMSTESCVDLAYFGISDNLDDICRLNGNKGTAVYCEFGTEKATLNLATGSFITDGEDETESPNPETFIDPASGWTESDLTYRSAIDFINGTGDGSGAHDQRGGTSEKGIDILTFDGPTADNAYLAIAGWTVIDKGVEKYMWSADDGKTWNECVLFGRETFATVDAGNGIIAVANNMFGYNYLQYQANSIYQGSENVPSGIAAHLTDYVGETVNVIFAAVPATETDKLCLIAYIKNVRVYESDEAAVAGEKALEEACTHQSAVGYVFVDDGDDATDEAHIQSVCQCGEAVFETSIPSYVFFFGKIADQSVAPLVFETKYNYRTFDSKAFEVGGNVKSFKADADGKLYMSGWAGVNGGIADIVFKVFDANGNELTSGWTTTGATFKTNQSDLNPEMAKRGIEEKYGARYDLTIDLSSYFASNEQITVKLALEISDISEDCGDKYVSMGEFTNVAKSAS